MAWIIESPNPFSPLEVIKTQVPAGTNLRKWVEKKFPETGEFPVPTICLLNGNPVLRKDWGTLKDKDIVNFVAVQGWELIVAIIIAVVVSLAVSLLMPVPKGPNEVPSSDPVFSVKGQGNSIRLGEPIENSYGRNRIFPSYASRPYFEYDNNDQFQYSLFCLGQGLYDIEAVQIGDTAIANFQEAEYEIVPPGEEVLLFPTNVFTSPEAGGQTLFAPNQPEYPLPDGWVGPFPANPAGTLASQIQIDLVAPKGLYVMSNKGDIGGVSVHIEVMRRLIDDAGAPLGAWEMIDDDPFFDMSGVTTTPQRRTFRAEVPLGRYEIRARRLTGYNFSDRVGEDILWEGLRSWIEIGHDYGNVTLLAVKIRATNNLNDRTAQRFNVICTRKLPVRESSGIWSEPIPTRSIVWAFVDIFRAEYGGRITDDNFFDWDMLLALDSEYATRNDCFDWIFRDPITVWDAARTVAAVGRAVPLLSGSLITMRRDGPQTVPVTIFNHENIVEGSFEWQIKLWDADEFDSMRVEYTEISTGYKQETVMAILPGDGSDHPEDVRLIGVQGRTQAYREGLYRIACRRYLRENVSFETGLEGYIPTYGDLIGVSHDVPRWGQAGYVVQAQRGEGIKYQIWLSEPLNWEESGDHQILFRSKNGGIIGPFDALQTVDTQQVMIESAEDIDFLLDGTTEPTLFMFGIVGYVSKLMKVVRVEPQGEEKIRISAVNEAPIVHTFDSLEPTALGQFPYAPVPPALPEIANIYITPIDGSLLIVQISWTAAFGALSYIVDTSEDGVTWTRRAEVPRTSVQLQVHIGDLYARVAAINEGQGPWKEGHIIIGPITALGLQIPWEFLEWGISWFDVLEAVGWEVKVYDNSGVSPVLKNTTAIPIEDPREFLYDYAQAIIDGNLVREHLVTVDVKYLDETGTSTVLSGVPAQLELSNAIPAAPTSPLAAIDTVNPSDIDYEFTWVNPADDDLIRVKLWLSPISGFDPEVDVPVLDDTQPTPGFAGVLAATIQSIPLDSDGEHPAYYWRVAVFDVWGNEIMTNITGEQVIPAYP